MYKIVAFFLIIVFPLTGYTQRKYDDFFLKGKVVDEDKQPIQFALVSLAELNLSTYTDNSGVFSIRIDPEKTPGVTLNISVVGKKMLSKFIIAQEFNKYYVYMLQNLSLKLQEVQVVARQKEAQSNSSVVFDREAIENAQAFSLADIMMGLPGKTLTAPQLQNPQQLTLRSDAGTNHVLSNSLGIGIIVDGLAISNDANMQNRNPGVRQGLTGSAISSRLHGSFDVPFGGVDLREIPADNIESIEVISGVAPAQYDDITDGAVIINRQAGRTDYRFVTRVGANSTNFSLVKGYRLGHKAGALNVSMNYLYSTADPRDHTKSLNRLNGSLMWTKQFGRNFKNTLSVDGNERLDQVKLDPDDPQKQKTVSVNRNFSVSERASLKLDGKFLRKIDFNGGFSYGYQDSYTEWWLNQGIIAVTYKDTTNAVYEGSFINVHYTTIEQVIGKPISVRANTSATGLANTGKIVHAISFGANYSYSDNIGPGIVADPERSRWNNGTSGSGGTDNDRPYDYRSLVPALVNYGFYANDKFKFKLMQKTFSVNAGLRYDIQNGYGTVQPRINTSYSIAKDLQLTMAYGIATKAPTLAHRYPSPTFYDISLIREISGSGVVEADKSLHLVYTEKYTPDNSHLKPSRSDQMELGLRLNKSTFSSSLFFYHKNNRDGFGTVASYRNFELPKYETTVNGDGKIEYYPTGDNIPVLGMSHNIITNQLNSKNTGVEWFISSPKIEPLQTRINLVNSFSYSYFRNSENRVLQTTTQFMQMGKKAWYGLYLPQNHEQWTLRSKINTTTHIPKLGFYINLNTDIHWQVKYKSIGRVLEPIAWYDKDFNEHPIAVFDENNPDYGHLKLNNADAAEGNQPLVYANLSAQLAKEINQRIRFSMNAYNLLNARVRYYNPATGSVRYYNAPIAVSAELSIKF